MFLTVAVCRWGLGQVEHFSMAQSGGLPFGNSLRLPHGSQYYANQKPLIRSKLACRHQIGYDWTKWENEFVLEFSGINTRIGKQSLEQSTPGHLCNTAIHLAGRWMTGAFQDFWAEWKRFGWIRMLICIWWRIRTAKDFFYSSLNLLVDFWMGDADVPIPYKGKLKLTV